MSSGWEDVDDEDELRRSGRVSINQRKDVSADSAESSRPDVSAGLFPQSQKNKKLFNLENVEREKSLVFVYLKRNEADRSETLENWPLLTE